MPWPAIATVQQWVGKRRGLLAGVIDVAVHEAISLVPGAHLAVRAAVLVGGAAAKIGLAALAPGEEVAPALPNEQMDQINAWLETLTNAYTTLLDKLEALPNTDAADEQGFRAVVEQALQERDDLAAEFDAHARDARQATLSLGRVEQELDSYFHERQQVALSLEEIKSLFVESPLLCDWAEVRQARPEALQALRRSDEAFQSGRGDESAAELAELLRQRGAGHATLCRLVGLRSVSRGDLDRARSALEGIDGVSRPASLTRALTGLSTASTRGGGVGVWRSLPRGFVLNRKYRVEAEVGRGGTASVYRCAAASQVRAGEVVAVKVPAPGLMADAAACARFVKEIEVSLRLSADRRPSVVQTLGYEVFDDPHTGRELYGMVLEYIDGPSLAQFLAQRQAKNKPLTPKEIVHVLKPVCEALGHAHAQNVYHRDIKPHNVMLTGDGAVKLTDFGIARVLEDCRATLTGQGEVGTPVYMPPDRDFDVRSDVYLLGNLLLELLTFDPRGDVESRTDCPPAWMELVADSMNRLKGKRPGGALEFLARLEYQPATPTEEPAAPTAPLPPPPPPKEKEPESRPPDEFTARVQREKQRVEAAHETARRCAETEYDYAAAARALEPIAEHLRDDELYATVCRKRDRVAQLDREIRIAVEAMRLQGLAPKVEELLRLQPNRADLSRLLAELPEAPPEITNSIGMKLVRIPAGKFLMGSPKEEQRRNDDEGPVHEVEITQPFYLGIYPVTQGKYERVRAANPSLYERLRGINPSHFKIVRGYDTRRFPVESVSWKDAVEFCRLLSAMPEEKRAGRVYRLPTEAEWEYACRAGASDSQPFYFDKPTAILSPSDANFDGRQPYGGRKGRFLGHPSPVGSYSPNAFGVYDMHGNVWEWCSDLYDARYYRDSPRKDPQGPEDSREERRVLRGGSWLDGGESCRAALRDRALPAERSHGIGFRVVCCVGVETF
jgi:formylglycine-generating enzyme required for sulfatase activity